MRSLLWRPRCGVAMNVYRKAGMHGCVVRIHSNQSYIMIPIVETHDVWPSAGIPKYELCA